MKVVVVLPTYNEAENLPRMVERLFSLGINGLQVLVVDDNSPDGTGDLADELAEKHPTRVSVIHRKGKLGLGSAYVAGFKKALEMGADYIVQMDTDFSHPTERILDMLAAMKDYDVVVGSRYVAGGSVDKSWAVHRKLLSSEGNRYARLVTGLKVRDVTGGFKCFRRKVLEAIELDKVSSDGFAFQTEMAYACQKKGFRVLEIPIIFMDRTHGASKMSFKIIWEAFWKVWQIRGRY